MIYIDLDASVMRLLKRNSSPADLMHSPISMSDHSAPPTPPNLMYVCSSSGSGLQFECMMFFNSIGTIFHSSLTENPFTPKRISSNEFTNSCG